MTDLRREVPSERKTRRFEVGPTFFRIGRIVFLGVLFILFFFLAHAMVHHRFFNGGRYDRNGRITQ
jgi:zona occludens toxin (predicted ATPase)